MNGPKLFAAYQQKLKKRSKNCTDLAALHSDSFFRLLGSSQQIVLD